MNNKLMLYINTIRYLKISQILYLIKNKTTKKHRIIFWNNKKSAPNIHWKNINLVIPELDYSLEFLKKFNLEQLIQNKVVFLHEVEELDLEKWNVENKSPLWNFNLHYFEFGIALAYAAQEDRKYYDKFKELCLSWINNTDIWHVVAWHPYVISMRIINWLISINILENFLNEDTEFLKVLYQSLFKQYKYLLRNQEKHLLGNHYFENIKAIIICSYIFGEEANARKYASIFQKEIKRQILSDGVHYELSIMYEKIILEDLLRIYIILKESCNLPKDLKKIIEGMADCIYSLEQGMGKTPFFNDSADGIAKETDCLLAAVKRIIQYSPRYKTEFEAGGYFKAGNEAIQFILDCGKMGPDFQTGHGQCDALSFELSIKNTPFFVNSGTYAYQGENRAYFRSTCAHNTVVINGSEQSQCWAEHRTAKRISELKCEPILGGYKGSYKNYDGAYHFRSIWIEGTDLLYIKDKIKASDDVPVQSYLHLYPEFYFHQENDKSYGVYNRLGEKKCDIFFPRKLNTIIHRTGNICLYSPEFGKLQHKEVLEIDWYSGQAMLIKVQFYI